MRRLIKPYPLKYYETVQIISAPASFSPLCIKEWNRTPILWADMEDGELASVEHEIFCFDLANITPIDDPEDLSYIGTFQITGTSGAHYFYKKPSGLIK